MSELVLLHHNEPMTTSLAIADGTENSHEAVIKLVRKYAEDLQEFGPCGFEIQMVDRKQGGGRPIEYAYLNEPQATLLITYMRNSDIVRRFKIALVKAFYELRDRIAVPPAPTFAAVDHRADVTVSADRTFRAILRSSRAAGLRLPASLQRANAITLRDTGIDMLNTIGIDPSVPENDPEAIDDGGVADFTEEWLADRLPLPATICQSSALYRAYSHWRRMDDAAPVPINKFIPLLTASSPDLRAVSRHAIRDGRQYTVRSVIVRSFDRRLDANICGGIHIEIERFAVALADWMQASE